GGATVVVEAADPAAELAVERRVPLDGDVAAGGGERHVAEQQHARARAGAADADIPVPGVDAGAAAQRHAVAVRGGAGAGSIDQDVAAVTGDRNAVDPDADAAGGTALDVDVATAAVDPRAALDQHAMVEVEGTAAGPGDADGPAVARDVAADLHALAIAGGLADQRDVAAVGGQSAHPEGQPGSLLRMAFEVDVAAV